MCLLTVAEGNPFQADASVTAQLNIIHMLDRRRFPDKWNLARIWLVSLFPAL
jgi:hypothetical protein